jgi:hypothetical protein
MHILEVEAIFTFSGAHFFVLTEPTSDVNPVVKIRSC